MYSFGVLLYEVISQRKAWQGRTDEQIEHAVVHGERPVLEERTIQRYADAPFSQLPAMVQRCWHPEYLARPSAAQICDELFRQPL